MTLCECNRCNPEPAETEQDTYREAVRDNQPAPSAVEWPHILATAALQEDAAEAAHDAGAYTRASRDALDTARTTRRNLVAEYRAWAAGQ